MSEYGNDRTHNTNPHEKGLTYEDQCRNRAKLDRILQEHQAWCDDRRTGQRADFSGADLCWVDFHGANLFDAIFREANLYEADLRGTTLRWTDFFGANLFGANVSEADLRYAKNCIRLDMVDPRGYQPVAVATNEGWRIFSGCRSFDVENALGHWGPDYEGEREIGERYIRAIEALPDCAKERRA